MTRQPLSAARRYGAEAARLDLMLTTNPAAKALTDARHARLARAGRKVPTPWS